MTTIARARRALRIVASVALALSVYLAEPCTSAAREWTWPVHGTVITAYQNDNARPYAGGMHRGIDIAAAVGTPVAAAHAGRVSYAGALGSAGLTVSIAGSDGRYVASYLHLSEIAVHRGERIAAGEQVGAVGTTGSRSAPAPHLHFGVHVAGERHLYIDPLTLLGPLPRGERQAPATVPGTERRAVPAPQRAPVSAAPERGPRMTGAPAPARVPVRWPFPAPHRREGSPAVPGSLAKVLLLAGLALIAVSLTGAAAPRRLRRAIAGLARAGAGAYERIGAMIARRNAHARRLERRPSVASLK